MPNAAVIAHFEPPGQHAKSALEHSGHLADPTSRDIARKSQPNRPDIAQHLTGGTSGKKRSATVGSCRKIWKTGHRARSCPPRAESLSVPVRIPCACLRIRSCITVLGQVDGHGIQITSDHGLPGSHRRYEHLAQPAPIWCMVGLVGFRTGELLSHGIGSARLESVHYWSRNAAAGRPRLRMARLNKRRRRSLAMEVEVQILRSSRSLRSHEDRMAVGRWHGELGCANRDGDPRSPRVGA